MFNDALNAIYRHDLKMFECAIKNLENIDSLDSDKRSLLINACIEENLEIIEKLLLQNPKIDIQDYLGMSALHYVASNVNIPIAQLLLNAGATIDLKDRNGNTPLNNAVFESGGEGRMIMLLLSHGADSFCENDYGISPIKLAETISNFDVRQFFNE